MIRHKPSLALRFGDSAAGVTEGVAKALTEKQIISWMKKHRATFGQLPSQNTTDLIPDMVRAGENWAALNRSLAVGQRGLPGQQTLASIKAVAFGTQHPMQLPDLTELELLRSMKQHHAETGMWPSCSMNGLAPGINPPLSWKSVDRNLRMGLRGLTKGGSIARLLQTHGLKINRITQSRLTTHKILSAAKKHKAHTGTWPTRSTKDPVPDLPGDTWKSIDNALRQGSRGLIAGKSLPKLLDESGALKRSLSVAEVLQSAREHHRLTGNWPKSTSKSVAPKLGMKWSTVNACLIQGLKGLEGGISLPQLLQKEGLYTHRLGKPNISKLTILQGARRHYERTGAWPTLATKGAIEGIPDTTWAAVDRALRKGRRGLPGGSGLAALIAQNFGSVRSWTTPRVRELVETLTPHLATMSQAEMWAIVMQSGALESHGVGKDLLNDFIAGKVSPQEALRVLGGDELEDEQELPERNDDTKAAPNVGKIPEDRKRLKRSNDNEEEDDDDERIRLRTLSTQDILTGLDSIASRVSDEFTINFLVTKAKDKLMAKVLDDPTAVKEIQRYRASDKWSKLVKEQCLKEIISAQSLKLPAGYAFKKPGQRAITKPNLMQLIIAWRVLTLLRVGNWSGTGAGKTLSAVLSARLCQAALTVVVCPNNTVDGWVATFLATFPRTEVLTKTFTPEWRTRHPKVLVLNIEMFQQSWSDAGVEDLVGHHKVDFIVLDEIHTMKQRNAILTRRRENVGLMRRLATEKNRRLRVLGMSATPVVNNLREGIALAEMITGQNYDLPTDVTVKNCMMVHQLLTTLGARWIYPHETKLNTRQVKIDGSKYLQALAGISRKGTFLQYEAILMRAKLPTIAREIRPKTLIYTELLRGDEPILDQLRKALSKKWKVGVFTGEDKSGLNGFVNGDVDVLIASSAIALGVDGLQHVCSRLIFAILPWTHAQYEQIVGRVHRQGQKRGAVEIIIPTIYCDVEGQPWSLCQARLDRINFKKTVADAAVDGVVPQEALLSPERVLAEHKAWLERLQETEAAE